jgi:hypothetical protein
MSVLMEEGASGSPDVASRRCDENSDCACERSGSCHAAAPWQPHESSARGDLHQARDPRAQGEGVRRQHRGPSKPACAHPGRGRKVQVQLPLVGHRDVDERGMQPRVREGTFWAFLAALVLVVLPSLTAMPSTAMTCLPGSDADPLLTTRPSSLAKNARTAARFRKLRPSISFPSPADMPSLSPRKIECSGQITRSITFLHAGDELDPLGTGDDEVESPLPERSLSSSALNLVKSVWEMGSRRLNTPTGDIYESPDVLPREDAHRLGGSAADVREPGHKRGGDDHAGAESNVDTDDDEGGSDQEADEDRDETALRRMDSHPDELASPINPPNSRLASNVAELCEKGRAEAALELVRTDLCNVTQPQCTEIMLAFAEAGRSDCAQAALLHMQTLCVETGAELDINVFNALMLAYARDAATATDDGIDQAFGVLDLMLRANVDPDITTYNRLMEACAAAADVVEPFSKGLQVLDAMKEGKHVHADVETFNTMLEACGKRGWSTSTGDGLSLGAQVLEKMREEEVVPTVDTFNILMYGCAWAAGAGDGWLGVEQGLDFLQQMAEKEIMPDVISFNNLIAACAQAAGASDGPLARDQAFKLLRMMQAVGLHPDQGTCDTLIATCAKTAAAGDTLGVTYGVQVLELAHSWNLSPDPSMYNALLARCLQVAQSKGPGYPAGWNGLRWMSNLVALLVVLDVDSNEATHSIYDSMSSLCAQRALELAGEAACTQTQAQTQTQTSDLTPVDSHAARGVSALSAHAVAGSENSGVANEETAKGGSGGICGEDGGGGKRDAVPISECAAVPFEHWYGVCVYVRIVLPRMQHGFRHAFLACARIENVSLRQVSA